jgi:hypothetical protein
MVLKTCCHLMLDPSWDATNGVTSQNCDVRLENWKKLSPMHTDHKLTNCNWQNQKVEEELRRWALGINLK